jgi:hypothetical protein
MPWQIYDVRFFAIIGAVYSVIILWIASRISYGVAGNAPGWGAMQILFIAQGAWLGVFQSTRFAPS